MPTDKHTRAVITRRLEIADDLWTMRIRPEEPVGFKPGQYATLGVEADPRPIERAYSIASAPHEGELEFFIELVPEGKLTPRLHALKEGDSLWVRKMTRGHFVFDEREGKTNHLMISTVTGIAPFVSMSRDRAHRLAAGESLATANFFLMQGASRSWELAYSDEMLELERDHEWLRYVPTVSRPHEDSEWKGLTGRVHDLVVGHLERFCCGPSDTVAYLCGHPGMIEAAKGILAEVGFDKADVHDEKYWIPKAGSADE